MHTQKMYSILIVDDNPNNLFTLRTLLENSLDAEVIEAESGFAALEKISEYQIDLILLDIQMPDLNGFEVARLIRSRSKFKNIPIIFLTAVYKSEDFKQLGFDSGAIDYLTKPIDDAILMSRLNAYLRVISGEREINRQLSEINAQLEKEVEARTRAEEALVELNQKLKEASRHKTDYLSSMSHELRTPLNALIGYIALALNSLQTEVPPEKLENLNKASQTSRILLQLINDVLDFAKIEAGKIETLIEEVDLEEIIEDVAITAEGLLLEKAIEIRTEIDSELPEIQSDYTKIKQMLNNLVGNAIKFTSEGFVTIRAQFLQEQQRIRLEVEDTGPGIPQEKLGSVFESFQQADSSIKKKFGGTGLGLTITKNFCTMLGIGIGVESEVDKGTCFWLEIPLKSPSLGASEPEEELPAFTLPEEPAASDTSQAQNTAGTFHSVLIIDDDEMNLQVVGETLHMLGYTQHQALGASEGILAAKEVQPDVILMDLSMPDIDGLEATRLLRQDSETAHIPIIACSAHVTQDVKENAMKAGCAGFISRPIEPIRLVEQMAKILGVERLGNTQK